MKKTIAAAIRSTDGMTAPIAAFEPVDKPSLCETGGIAVATFEVVDVVDAVGAAESVGTEEEQGLWMIAEPSLWQRSRKKDMPAALVSSSVSITMRNTLLRKSFTGHDAQAQQAMSVIVEPQRQVTLSRLLQEPMLAVVHVVCKLSYVFQLDTVRTHLLYIPED